MDPLDYLEPIDITSKLPKDLDEQFMSKKWQDRKNALDSVHGILTENPKLADNPDYVRLIEQLTKMLGSDANINCASQAAKCLIGFAKGLGTKFGPNVASVVPVIFDKFKEKKASLRDPLIGLIDAIFAISNLTILIPPIMEAAKKPNPSQKSQLDQFLYRAFRSLDPKEIPKGILKDLVTVISEHAFDPDAEVRDSACAALGAIQKCIGEKALAMFLSNNLTADPTKMAKITEYKEKAESEAAKLNVEKANSGAKAEPSSSSHATSVKENNTQQNEISVKQPEVDPWDMLDPVDVMPKLPKDLDEQFVSKKWQERKAALDMVHSILTENPKLTDNPDYVQLIEQLTKMLGSDANINCAAQAAKCLTGFAKGLRTKFAHNALTVAPVVFEKFREKKATLKDPLVELIDAVFASSNLKNLIPTIMEAAKKPNPSQKSQLDQFLYRAFRSLDPKEIPKGILKDLVAVISEHAFDPDAEVRDSACAALGAIQKCIGEKALAMFLSNNLTTDPTKMAKLTEYKEKAESEFPSQLIVKTEVLPVNQAKPPSNQKEQQEQPQPIKELPNVNENESAKKNQKAVKQQPPETPQPAPPRNIMDPVDIMQKLPKNLEEQLVSKTWQERKTALDQLHGILTDNPRLADNPDYVRVIEQLTRMLGTDANINCAAQAARCLIGFANGLRVKFGPNVASVAPIVFDKFKEKKATLKDPLIELIDAVFATSNLKTILPSIMEAAKKPNPNQKSHLDQFIYRIFSTLDPKEIPKGTLKDLITVLSEHAFDLDAEVRDSAYAALGSIQKCVGDKAMAMHLNNKLISDVVKMAKIAEYKERAETADALMPKTSAPNPQVRARSASSTRNRRTLAPSALANESTNSDDTTLRAPRRSHAGILSSAQSHSSALNTTARGGGLFQLDPKFFDNEFDDTTLAMNVNSTATIPGSVNRSALNATFTKPAGPAERGILGRNGSVGGGTVDSQDFQPIKPVIRPTSTFSRRSESVSSISSLESAEHIDRAVHNVSSLQLNIAEESIAQLLHLHNDPIHRQYIVDRAELVLREIITQIFHIRNQHFEQLESANEADSSGHRPSPRSAAKEAELNEFMRSMCNFLSSLTKESAMMFRISTDTLRAFMDAILSLCNDNRLKILNTQIYRSLNLILIRLCDQTNPNSCFVALMKLAVKYQDSQHPDPGGKMVEMIRKCMIKHTDVLADPMRVEQIDVPTVLEPVHAYYLRFYVPNEQREIDECTKQTTKVICIYIQRLVVHKRYSILNHLYQFPENSHLVTYIRRCVRAVGKRSAETPDGCPTMPEELEKLFTRISDDIFSGAVEDLYNFMDIHPEQNANFEQLMAQCDYSSIVRKAFAEVRQCRLKRQITQPGASVRRALPQETQLFLQQQNQLLSRIEHLTSQLQLNGTSPLTMAGGNGSQKSTPN